MAQASSVPAREPSMEEILASIRRIIEDSDGGQAPGQSVAPEQAAANPEPEDTPISSPPTGEALPRQAGEPADMAHEVAAFRSEFADAERDAEQQPVLDAPSETEIAEASFAPAAFDPAANEPLQAHELPEGFAEEPRPEPVRESQGAPVERDMSRQVDTAWENTPPRTSILSETAGRQVAAAFEELSDAFSASQRRSFDEIAEELMRPMLQDWLDNNLPVLVERLVREEIERVARGGR